MNVNGAARSGGVTLAEFLTARLGEDQKRAEFFGTVPVPADPRSDWYALQSPARVLREVAAKRAILAEHRPVPMRGIEAGSCSLCRLPYPCPTVRALLAVWSDHPDYDDRWKL